MKLISFILIAFSLCLFSCQRAWPKQSDQMDINMKEKNSIKTDATVVYEEVNNMFIERFQYGKGNRYCVMKLNIEGKGNKYVVNKGGVYEMTLDVFHECYDCGNAINQIITGLNTDDKAQACLSSCIVTSDHWKTVRFSLYVPNERGVYYIRTRYAQAYECESALDWWKTDRPNEPGSDANIGFIEVK